MWTPKSRTEETGNTSTVPIHTDVDSIWCWRLPDEHHRTSVLTDLPAVGWPSSTTAPLLHKQTFCRRGRRHHMVDRSRRSACRLHEEPAGGVLSAAGDRRRTAGKGSDRGPILVEPHAGLVMAASRSNLCGWTACGQSGKMWTTLGQRHTDHRTSTDVAAVSGGLQCQTLQTGPSARFQVPEGCHQWPSNELFQLSGGHGTSTVKLMWKQTTLEFQCLTKIFDVRKLESPGK